MAELGASQLDSSVEKVKEAKANVEKLSSDGWTVFDDAPTVRTDCRQCLEPFGGRFLPVSSVVVPW